MFKTFLLTRVPPQSISRDSNSGVVSVLKFLLTRVPPQNISRDSNSGQESSRCSRTININRAILLVVAVVVILV